MDKRMNENAALPADMRAAETGADTALGREKTYVKPAMQVFPLGCGLLAMSVVSGEPVQVTISAGIDMYYFYDHLGCIQHVPDIAYDDFKKIPFLKDKLPMDALGYTEGSVIKYCFHSDGLYGPSVSFEAGGGVWDADFLADLELPSGIAFPSGSFNLYEDDKIMVPGTYRGTPVVVTLVLRFRQVGG
ncbi:MAG: hypothetical protein IJ722_00380 [Alloprevotella sp.]|nr:hypothetical protein [Alloprevotella sp.]